MRKAALAASLAALACGCAGRRLTPGPQKGGYAVETAAPTVEEARKAAVESLIDLFVAPEKLEASTQAVHADILSDPSRYIVKERTFKEPSGVRLRALVSYPRLGKKLDELKLIRPEGVKGKPHVLISLREINSINGREALGVGRASDTMRRNLLARGYAVIDFSDALNGGRQKTGSREEALEAGKKAKADVVVTGQVVAEESSEPAMMGYGRSVARLRAEVLKLDGDKEKLLTHLDQEASAVDVRAPDAAAKSLESAGELAGDVLHAALAQVFHERLEYTVAVINLGNADRARQLVAALRKLPPVAAAAVDAFAGKDVKLRLFVDRIGADELAAQLLRLKEFNLHVRAVEPDFFYVELQSGGAEEGF